MYSSSFCSRGIKHDDWPWRFPIDASSSSAVAHVRVINDDDGLAILAMVVTAVNASQLAERASAAAMMVRLETI